MACYKFHVMCDITVLLSMTDLNASYKHESLITALLMYKRIGIVLVYLNCHMYILFAVAFTLVSRFRAGCN